MATDIAKPPVLRHTPEKIREIVTTQAPMQWVKVFNADELKIAHKIMREIGAAPKAVGKPVDFQETVTALKSDKDGGDVLAALKVLSAYAVKSLPDDKHFLTLRLGKRGQGWCYVAENHRKVEGKTVMVPFTEYDGHAVPILFK